MPSRLRQQEYFEPISAETTFVRPAAHQQPPQKKQKMSLSQTYYIASSARAKLGKEASRPDHNLRLLVGHANLLDALMLELQDAEREQERWFNQTVQKAQKAEEPKHIQWADTIVEEDDEEDDGSDSDDSDSEYDENDFVMASQLRRLKSPPVTITSQEVDEDEDEEDEEYYDDMEDVPELALTRTSSKHNQPPELVDDSDSDDESPPQSPPQPTMDFSFDDKHALSAKEQEAFLENGFFIPERNAPMIAIQA